MSSEVGEQLMLWTVRASVACYVISVWRWLFFRLRPDPVYSRFWFFAWLLCVIHVVCAFQFRHHWNHATAIQHTAEMTERVVGLRWGGGLYINYVFLLCWGCSAVPGLRNRNPEAEGRRRLTIGLHAFVAFMMFNATAIFGPPWWWIPTVLLLLAIAGRVIRSQHEPPAAEPKSS